LYEYRRIFQVGFKKTNQREAVDNGMGDGYVVLAYRNKAI
jgi:hypothetical protein